MNNEYRMYAEERLKSCRLRLQTIEAAQNKHVGLMGSPEPEFDRQIRLIKEEILKWEDVLNMYIPQENQNQMSI